MTPRLLDLFCGAGGCSVGYHRAGFDVVGVDNTPHPDYPYEFRLADALDVLADTAYLAEFDVIHASPPCPRYSASRHATGRGDDHPDLVPPVRNLLAVAGRPYVIENVVGAPMPAAVLLCGWALGLKHLPRHRLFESNLLLMSPGCGCPTGDSVSVFGHSGEDRRHASLAAQAHLKPRANGRVRSVLTLADARQLMGIDWMTNRDDLSDAIPPAYTEFIGWQLADQLGVGMIPVVGRRAEPGDLKPANLAPVPGVGQVVGQGVVVEKGAHTAIVPDRGADGETRGQTTANPTREARP